MRSGNDVVATLSLLNTGLYDAYGVEAIMVAPDDTITITNNTVGGSGRVRALNQVIVGSRILLQRPCPRPGARRAMPCPPPAATTPATRTAPTPSPSTAPTPAAAGGQRRPGRWTGTTTPGAAAAWTSATAMPRPPSWTWAT